MAALNKIPYSVRLAFNFKSWQPSENEWCQAIIQLQPEERERINKFRYRDDAKASLIGRLMIRKWCGQFLSEFGCQGIANSISRTEKGRPILVLDPSQKKLIGNINFDFNVAHAGDFTVFAAEISEHNVSVGVDVMPLFNKRRDENLEEFLRLMKRQFTTKEWAQIRKIPPEYDEGLSDTMKNFYRFWCLKESFVKAEGTGLAWNLQRLNFNCLTSELKSNAILTDTELEIDGNLKPDWQFHEQLLNVNHCASVALCGNASSEGKISTPFQTVLINELLDELNLNNLHSKTIDSNVLKKEWDLFLSKEVDKPF